MFFTNSGAEALECSIKMARKYHAAKGHPERFRLITFEGAFHGRTLATIAAGGQAKYLEGFGPKVEGFDQVPFGDFEALKAAIGPETAGILIEPIQGEGGVRPVPPAMLCGRCARSATNTAFCWSSTKCNAASAAPASSSPMNGPASRRISWRSPRASAAAFRWAPAWRRRMRRSGMTAGTHGSTFGGNPLATAVGNAVLDVVLDEGFLDNVLQRALSLKQKLARLKDEHPTVIEDIRGSGLMMGIKCKVPNTEFQAAALDQQLLTIGAGDNVVRLLPPLIVSDDDIAEAVAQARPRPAAALEAKAA